MTAEGAPFRGVLFAGLMLDQDAGRKLIEYNCRFGDPECQVLMMRLKSDIVPALLACAPMAAWRISTSAGHEETALTVVMAARGYPEGDPLRGTEIRGLEGSKQGRGRDISSTPAPSATAQRILANGGRVLNVTADGGFGGGGAAGAPMRAPSTPSTGRRASVAAISHGGRSGTGDDRTGRDA